MSTMSVASNVSERMDWLSQPKKRRDDEASPAYYNVADAYDACYKKNKPKLTFSKARGSTRLQFEEAALERSASRQSFGWDAGGALDEEASEFGSMRGSEGGSKAGERLPRNSVFHEPLSSGSGAPRKSVLVNQGRDPRASTVGRQREIAEQLYNGEAMFNPSGATTPRPHCLLIDYPYEWAL
jgi:hypothetical protein